MFLLPCYFALFILYFMTDFNILYQMATKPLTTEAIALTEKKMDMALEDIIKMSKNPKSRGRKQRRVPVRSFFLWKQAYLSDIFSLFLGCHHNIWILCPFRTKFRSFPIILLKINLQRFDVLWIQDRHLDRYEMVAAKVHYLFIYFAHDLTFLCVFQRW